MARVHVLNITGGELQTIPNGQSFRVRAQEGIVEVYDGQPHTIEEVALKNTQSVRGSLIGVVRLVDPVGAVILGE
jgi:hypothetical protein